MHRLKAVTVPFALAAMLLVALPAVAGPAQDSEPVDHQAQAEVPAAATADQAPAEAVEAAEACSAATVLDGEASLQASVGAASSCTAQTTCFDGETISCSGDSCFSDPHCFVVCDGNITRCNSACP